MKILTKIEEKIEEITDPRMIGKVQHNLSTIIFVALCGILSGCEDWNDIHDYCRVKKDWLSQYVCLKNGIPSSYTFRRVFALLDPNNIENLLRIHAAEIVQNNKQSDQIAVDGKALRGSRTMNTKCLHSVSAWCYENGLVPGEEQVENKSNEMTAIPLLLESLNLKGNTVTIDAAGCQKNIVAQIIKQKGNYVLGLKRNHPKLYEAVEKHIVQEGENDTNRLYDAFDNSHGRSVVRRRYFGYDIGKLQEVSEWSGAKTVVAVETISSKNNDPKRTVNAEWRYFLSNHKYSDECLPTYIRNHWCIENKLHWVLDVHMKEDDDKKAERKSARSFALLKRIALNIVKTKDNTPKRSVRRKLKHSAWDDNYLLNMLS